MARSRDNGATAIPSWEGPENALVPPGRYSAVAVRTKGPQWVRNWQRWSVLVVFELLGETDETQIPAYFNMGNDPQKPCVGRLSRYFKAWCIANGEAPRKGQAMTLDVFKEGQVFEVDVVTISKADPGVQPYSRVERVVSAGMSHESGVISHKSIVNQSSSQPVKEAIGAHGLRSRLVETETHFENSEFRLSRADATQPKQTKRAGVSAPAQAISCEQKIEKEQYTI